jgi:hypothetical protein
MSPIDNSPPPPPPSPKVNPEYKLIFGTPRDLSKEVSKALQEGWTLYGLPFPNNGYTYQAVIKS